MGEGKSLGSVNNLNRSARMLHQQRPKRRGARELPASAFRQTGPAAERKTLESFLSTPARRESSALREKVEQGTAASVGV